MAYTETLSPSSDNIYLGRGTIYFAPFSGTTNMGEIHLGNAKDISISFDSDKLTVMNYMQGLASTYKEIIRETTGTLSFNLYEYSMENLKLFTYSTESTLSQSTAAVTDEAVTARLDRWVALAYRDISLVTVQDVTDTTTYTLNTDYELDTFSGRIKALSTGSISDTAVLHVDYTYADAAITKLQLLQDTDISGLIRVKGAPAAGPTMEVIIWQSTISPSGDLSLITDDAGELSFEASIEADTTNHATEPYGVIYYYGISS